MIVCWCAAAEVAAARNLFPNKRGRCVRVYCFCIFVHVCNDCVLVCSSGGGSCEEAVAA
jgi:hypothetical protein